MRRVSVSDEHVAKHTLLKLGLLRGIAFPPIGPISGTYVLRTADTSTLEAQVYFRAFLFRFRLLLYA